MDPALQLALRAAFALLLASAASHKLRDVARFRGVLAAYHILPSGAVVLAAPAVAVVEALLAVAITAGLRAGAAGAAALMLAYAAAIHLNVRRGRTDIDCGCMGPASRVPLGAGLVLRNLGLATFAALLALPVSSRPLAWFDAVGVAAATAALAACWLATERMLALAPRVARLKQKRRPAPIEQQRTPLWQQSLASEIHRGLEPEPRRRSE